MEQPTPQPKPTPNNEELTTVKAVTEHFQKQLDEEKKKHAEEIAKLEKEIKDEKERHIKDIQDILTAGKISIPQDDTHNPTEEEELLKNMRKSFNLK